MRYYIKNTFKKNIYAFLFVLPALAFIFIFMIYPLFDAFHLSFFDWKLIGEKKFVGLENYIKLFLDNRIFYTSLRNNVYFSIVSTAGTVLIGLILAAILDRNVKGWKVFRVLYYLPVVLSSVSISMLWLRIYDPNMGLLKRILDLLNLGFLKREWLGDPRLAIFCIILVVVWQFSGFTMVFFLAAMHNISKELYEAAEMDGISTFQEFRYITFPLIKPIVIIVIMLELIFSFKVFDIVWVMTTGGPGYSSSVLGTYLYTEAFRKFNIGFAEAIAVVMFVIIFTFSLIYLRFSKFEESVYEH